MFVTLQNLADPTQPVVVQDDKVLALEPVGLTGTRISIARGASNLIGPSYVEVLGDPPTIAGLLPGASFAPFTLLGTTSVCAVAAAYVQALEPIGSIGVRISIPRGTSEVTSPAPYIEVNGTIAAAIAALAPAATPATFASLFSLLVAAGAITTNLAAFVMVTGCQVVVPAAQGGTWLIFATAGVATSAVVNGVQISIGRNFAPFGAVGSWGPGDLSTTESVPWASLITLAAVPGDTFEVLALANPGGAGNDAVITEARIAAWRVSP